MSLTSSKVYVTQKCIQQMSDRFDKLMNQKQILCQCEPFAVHWFIFLILHLRYKKLNCTNNQKKNIQNVKCIIGIYIYI